MIHRRARLASSNVQVTSAVRVSKDGQRRYYSRRLRTVHFGLIVFVTLVAALGPSTEFANGDPHLFRQACILSLVSGLGIGWRILRRGLVAEPDRVVVRNLFWFRRIRKDVIAGFEASAPYGFHFGTGGLGVRKRNGKVVHVGVFVTTPVDGGVGVGTVEAKELNAWLTAVQAGVRSPPGNLVPAFKAYGGSGWRVLWNAFLVALLLLLMVTVVPALVDPRSFLADG